MNKPDIRLKTRYSELTMAIWEWALKITLENEKVALILTVQKAKEMLRISMGK